MYGVSGPIHGFMEAMGKSLLRDSPDQKIHEDRRGTVPLRSTSLAKKLSRLIAKIARLGKKFHHEPLLKILLILNFK